MITIPPAENGDALNVFKVNTAKRSKIGHILKDCKTPPSATARKLFTEAGSTFSSIPRNAMAIAILTATQNQNPILPMTLTMTID